MEVIQAANYFEFVSPLLRAIEALLVSNKPGNPVQYLIQHLPELERTLLRQTDATNVGVTVAKTPREVSTTTSDSTAITTTETDETTRLSVITVETEPVVASEPVVKEEVEMDTKDIQDLTGPALMELLLPDEFKTQAQAGVLPVGRDGRGDKFSLLYSRAALDGWVRQDSPCCAGASIAGAWNAIHCYNRYHPNAQDQHSGLAVLRILVQRKIDSSVASFQRLLGAPIDGLIAAVSSRMESIGRPLYVKGVTGQEAMRMAVAMALEVYEDNGTGNLTVQDGTPYLLLQRTEEMNGQDDGGNGIESSGSRGPMPVWVHQGLEYDCLRELLTIDAADALMKQANAMHPVPPPPSLVTVATTDTNVTGCEIRTAEGTEAITTMVTTTTTTSSEVFDSDASVPNLDAPIRINLLDYGAEDMPSGVGGDDDNDIDPDVEEEDEVVNEYLESVETPTAGSGSGRISPSPSAGSTRPPRKPSSSSKSKSSSSKGKSSSTSSRKGKGSSSGSHWKWRSALTTIFRQVGGLQKLSRPDKPNTAFIGNWGILAGVKLMQEEPELLPAHLRGAPHETVTISMFMGRGAKALIEVPLSAKDTPKAVIQQWNQLKAAFSRKRTAMIFHLRNHYAIIYAMRDYEASDGTRRKEILTARRGQRPTAWISWEEARETMLKWFGHKIMLLELKSDKPLPTVPVPIITQTPVSTTAESTAVITSDEGDVKPQQSIDGGQDIQQSNESADTVTVPLPIDVAVQSSDVMSTVPTVSA